MAEQKYSIDQDLKEARAMAQALVPYVYEDTLYARVGGGGLFGGQTPAMTIGALLLRLRRLQVLQDRLPPDQQAVLAEIQAQHDSALREWRTHYESKLTREVNSRVDDMQAFFSECREDPRLCASAYKPEALRRTIIQEIMLQMEKAGMNTADFNMKVKRADSDLRRFVKPGDFIWDATLQPVYPSELFWWLYGKPG